MCSAYSTASCFMYMFYAYDISCAVNGWREPLLSAETKELNGKNDTPSSTL